MSNEIPDYMTESPAIKPPEKVIEQDLAAVKNWLEHNKAKKGPTLYAFGFIPNNIPSISKRLLPSNGFGKARMK